MNAKPTISFKITGIDSLGQGVSKEDGKITFIHKTLPGEEGEASIIAQKKSVSFATLEKVTKPSSERITPVCPHFSTCPSCHFLHAPYEFEVAQKKKSLESIFYHQPLPEIQVIQAPHRLGYRNRIQLHYDTKFKKLGMLNVQRQEIVQVPECLIGLPEVAQEIKRLYQGQQWLKEVPANAPTGHVEIYWINNQLKLAWNRPYAEGGFTQVYEEMNLRLKSELQKWQSGKKPTALLDLFAGGGNLSTAIPFENRLCVDVYEAKSPGADFFSQQLYHPKALKNVKEVLKQRKMKIDLLILDPPRSGHKELQQWLQEISPREVAYVSCDPHTMARDLRGVKNYHIKQAFLFDFFPSTYHFETMIFLERTT